MAVYRSNTITLFFVNLYKIMLIIFIVCSLLRISSNNRHLLQTFEWITFIIDTTCVNHTYQAPVNQ